MTQSLSRQDAEKLIAAACYASKIGLPLNRHITIHWEQAGIADSRAGGATSRFLRLAPQWIAKKGERFAYVYVRENGDGKGSHVHILAHVPKDITLGSKQLGWLRKITNRPYNTGSILTTRVGGSISSSEADPRWYLTNLAVVIGYQLKGLPADVADQLGLVRPSQHGSIIGKRAGVSENIGLTARDACHKKS